MSERRGSGVRDGGVESERRGEWRVRRGEWRVRDGGVESERQGSGE